MNVQTAGLEMDICDGFFRQNGGCGYVLKPDFLRDAQSSFHPERPISPFKAQTLLIQIISGQQLPKEDTSKERSIVDPLVRVEIFGVRPDKSRQETSYVENNGETGLGGAELCWAGVRGVVVGVRWEEHGCFPTALSALVTWTNCSSALGRNPLTCEMLIVGKIARPQGDTPKAKNQQGHFLHSLSPLPCPRV